jgi:hypothetical protein
MNIDTVEIGKYDKVMVMHNIGAMCPDSVDEYSNNIVEKLVGIFGEGTVIFIPVRDGNDWDFTIIKKI